jgi:Asp-tRNA(Asn)/Glu-tRNA(Gln) amidotransferase A subunit family amidase
VRGRRAGFARVEAEAAFVHGLLHEKEPWRFSPEMRACLDYGAKMPATRLLEVNRRIDVAAFELGRCLEEVDAIVSPTTPQAAPAFGGPPNDNAGAFCILANFAGTPAISVPMGCDEAGLPLGLQFIGALHRDAQVLEIAAAYEAASGLAIYPPPPFGCRA